MITIKDGQNLVHPFFSLFQGPLSLKRGMSDHRISGVVGKYGLGFVIMFGILKFEITLIFGLFSLEFRK